MSTLTPEYQRAWRRANPRHGVHLCACSRNATEWDKGAWVCKRCKRIEAYLDHLFRKHLTERDAMDAKNAQRAIRRLELQQVEPTKPGPLGILIEGPNVCYAL